MIVCQANAQFTNKNLLEKSTKFREKAIYFENMPQYNYDSINYYFDKSINLLMENIKVNNYEIAKNYLLRNNISQVCNSYVAMDSIAWIGWAFLRNLPKTEKNNELKYNYLVNWAAIKLDLGENKIALKYFSQALVLVQNFKSIDFQMKIAKD